MKTVEHSGQTLRVCDATYLPMFKQVSEEEIGDYRHWADQQLEGTVINPLWHPIVQDQLFINGKGVEE